MVKYLYLSLVLFTVSGLSVFSQNKDISYTRKDSLLFTRYIEDFRKDKDKPSNELLIKTALFFKGTPYVASTLDKTREEKLVVNLREMDCTTFVENCIALVRTLKKKEQSFDQFCEELKNVRYKDGSIVDYTSRLHYITDWAYDNGKKKLLKDETMTLGGVFIPKTINFMSTHPDSYKQLSNNVILLDGISKVEDDINARKSYVVLAKDQIINKKDQIKDGDIIVFATSIKGLDYTHMGIAYKENGVLKFIHASTRAMKVIVENQSLVDYCGKSKGCTGITVLRILN